MEGTNTNSPVFEGALQYAQVMPRSARKVPRDWCTRWPDVVSDSELGEVARRFTIKLRSIVDELGMVNVERATRVHHATMRRILDGDVWPDMETIAKLELGLRVSLWSGFVAADAED